MLISLHILFHPKEGIRPQTYLNITNKQTKQFFLFFVFEDVSTGNQGVALYTLAQFVGKRVSKKFKYTPSFTRVWFLRHYSIHSL